MATTGFWPVKNRLKSVIDYAENPDKTTELKGVDKDLLDTINYASNPDKTDETLYVSAINCPKQRAYECMMATKQKYGKLGGNVAYHGYQSFREGEGLHPMKLIKSVWKQQEECGEIMRL